MNTNTKVLRELDELVEAARLLGVIQAKKVFGYCTDADRRFERDMRESIDKHRASLLARYTPPQLTESCESPINNKTPCGSENGNCDSQPAETGRGVEK